jgi:hypothetical protein
MKRKLGTLLKSIVLIACMGSTQLVGGAVADSSIVRKPETSAATGRGATDQRLPDISERTELLAVLLVIAAGFFIVVYTQKEEADREAGR